MFLQARVALGAGKALLSPCGMVAIRLEVVVFLILCGVTVGAIRIPIHALSNPVSPFSRQAILACIDIKPAVFNHIVSRTNGLEFVAW